ncbi:MAG: PDZ domain-containing protein [Fuerstiella sp.]|nr:PDZ domain-containing protein [Fuerstiella sp.]
MKPTTMSVLLFAGMSIPLVAHADEDPTKKTTTKNRTVKVLVQSSSEQKDDAAPKTSVKGRIVIVGPDGERQEYDLGESLPDGLNVNLGDVPHQHAHAHTVGGEPRHMIGIMCEPAGRLLRRHLKLTDQGLLASNVAEGLPAAAAGIQQDDILLAVGEQKLNVVLDLVNVVSASEGKELTIELLRDGERISIGVIPRELTGAEMKQVLSPLTFLHRHSADTEKKEGAHVVSEIRHVAGDDFSPHVVLRRFGPGMRLDHSAGLHEGKHILHLIKRMAEEQDSDADVEVDIAANGGAEAHGHAEASSVHHEITLKVLRAQVEQLRQQMATIEKQLEKADAE